MRKEEEGETMEKRKKEEWNRKSLQNREGHEAWRERGRKKRSEGGERVKTAAVAQRGTTETRQADAGNERSHWAEKSE